MQQFCPGLRGIKFSSELLLLQKSIYVEKELSSVHKIHTSNLISKLLKKGAIVVFNHQVDQFIY